MIFKSWYSFIKLIFLKGLTFIQQYNNIRKVKDMKKLMTGNEAIARGVYEAGCHFATAYPGTPSTEILEELTKHKEIRAEWASNEKVAMEAAIGASIAGGRAFASMKHVGVNVAADPLFTYAYMGVNGIVLFPPMTRHAFISERTR